MLWRLLFAPSSRKTTVDQYCSQQDWMWVPLQPQTDTVQDWDSPMAERSSLCHETSAESLPWLRRNGSLATYLTQEAIAPCHLACRTYDVQFSNDFNVAGPQWTCTISLALSLAAASEGCCYINHKARTFLSFYHLMHKVTKSGVVLAVKMPWTAGTPYACTYPYSGGQRNAQAISAEKLLQTADCMALTSDMPGIPYCKVWYHVSYDHADRDTNYGWLQCIESVFVGCSQSHT